MVSRPSIAVPRTRAVVESCSEGAGRERATTTPSVTRTRKVRAGECVDRADFFLHRAARRLYASQGHARAGRTRHEMALGARHLLNELEHAAHRPARHAPR